MSDAERGAGIPRSPFFVNAWVDAAFTGGLSIAAYLALRFLGGPAHEQTLSVLTLWSYSWIINGVHFAATSYRLYGSAGSMRQYPLTAVLSPVICAAGLWAALRWPGELAPAFVKLFLLWSAYHYAGQSLGLTAVYARRAGLRLSSPERLALAAFLYGTFVALAVRGESGVGPGSYFGVRLPVLGLPAWTGAASLIALAVCAAAFAGLLARRWRMTGESLPAIALLPAAAQFVWSVLGPAVPAFYQLVPMFHGLQYLLVAWFMQVQAAGVGTGIPGRLVASETARWAAWNLAGYAVLFWAIPEAASRASGRPILFSAPVALAAVQIHHFFVDGVIWKLRDAGVGRPLMAEAIWERSS